MADSLFRLSIKAFIQNDKGEVLVVKETGRDWWDLPGGGMDHGETVESALARELQEEVGYEGDFTMRIIGYYDLSVLERAPVEQVKLIFEVFPETYDFMPGKDGDEVAFLSPEVISKKIFDERMLPFLKR